MNCQHRRGFRSIPLALCVLLMAAGCNRAARESEPAERKADASAAPAADQRPKIVVLGDSLTAGLGVAPAEAFPAVLQRRIDAAGMDFEVVNAGVSGDTSAGGLRRLDWSLQGGAQVLIIALGANDGLRGLPIAEMKQNLGQIIETAQRKKLVVILAGMEAPPNYGPEYAAAFRQAYRDLARQYKVRFVPFLLDKVAGQASLNQADGIHPNVRGAELVADTVWTALKPELDRLSNS